jgi:hypothetical protein
VICLKQYLSNPIDLAIDLEDWTAHLLMKILIS